MEPEVDISGSPFWKSLDSDKPQGAMNEKVTVDAAIRIFDLMLGN